MLYVYRKPKSNGARMLVEALSGRRWSERYPRTPRRGDVVVCWGESLNAPEGVKVINGGRRRTKFEDAEALRAGGVSTIEVRRDRPTAQIEAAPPDPAHAAFSECQEDARAFARLNFGGRDEVFRDAVQDLLTSSMRLRDALVQPVPTPRRIEPVGEWVGRMNNHVGGTDLLSPPSRPDFWVKKEVFVKEFRVHSFMGRSIRAGIKAVREGVSNPSSWIRSWDGGWWMRYDGETVKQKHREIAHKAVATLGLQFGAVDIGERADGSLVVLEVNRAPGVEGGSIAAYKTAIAGWAAGG